MHPVLESIVRMRARVRKPGLLVDLLDKLEKLNIQEGILIVLLSMIYASMILILVPLVQLYAFPFIIVYVIFALGAIRSLPGIHSSQKNVDITAHNGGGSSALLEFPHLRNVREEIERAVVLRHVLHNPESSASQVAFATKIHENNIRTHLQNLVRKQLVIKQVKNFVDLYSLNYDNFHAVVPILRGLTKLEEHLKEFGNSMHM